MVLAVASGEPVREIAILALAGLSLSRTPREIRRANGFTSYPITEVAVALLRDTVLTMIPALELFQLGGPSWA